MEDKTLELLTKMYNEFSGKFDKIEGNFYKIEGRFDKFEGRFATIEKEIKAINTRLTKIEFCLENEVKPDIKASLEGYQMVYEKLINEEKAIEIINNKLEKQDVEITVIKGGKKEIL